jgi:hypothetical protein
MSYGRNPTGGDGIVPETVVRAARAVVARLRGHVAAWPRRLVEQQAEALGTSD